jgi:hypothetical protein
VTVAPHRGRSDATNYLGSGLLCLLGKSRIELCAIDHYGFCPTRSVKHLSSSWREKPGGRQLVEDRIPREIELFKRLARENPRAVDRCSNRLMFLEHNRGQTVSGEMQPRRQTPRTCANDDDVVHLLRSFHVELAPCQIAG